MPTQEKAFLKQYATLWPFIGLDRYGQASVGSPIEIRVRWLTVRSESTQATSTEIGITTNAQVDRKIVIGSHIWLGRLSDWYGTGSGKANSDDELMYVTKYNETPDLKNRQFMRTIEMIRLHSKNTE